MTLNDLIADVDAEEAQADRKAIENIKFWDKVNETESCWLWTGHLNQGGYGTFFNGTRHVLAHRWSYHLLVGQVPAGLQLDHLCRVRHCVRPSHLEPVTASENARRGETGMKSAALQRAKTHCPQGHLIDGMRPTGRRFCKTCHRLAQQRRRAR